MQRIAKKAEQMLNCSAFLLKFFYRLDGQQCYYASSKEDGMVDSSSALISFK